MSCQNIKTTSLPLFILGWKYINIEVHAKRHIKAFEASTSLWVKGSSKNKAGILSYLSKSKFEVVSTLCSFVFLGINYAILISKPTMLYTEP